jgi:hypothetical protein
MRNDCDAMNRAFWIDWRTTRYGIADWQHGFDDIAAFRAAQPMPHFTRRLLDTRITTFGRDTAVVQTRFLRSDTTKLGLQTQTWVRFAEGWKVVAAHVSLVDGLG